MFDLSLAYIRGDKLAFTISATYNFGSSKGIMPKIDNKLPYAAPVNLQELGPLRPEDVMMQDFIFAAMEQGLDITSAWLSYESGQRVLRLKIVNLIYREEGCLKERIVAILGALTPENIDKVIIVVDAFLTSVQEYHFDMPLLRRFYNKELGRYEFDLLTSKKEVTLPNYFESKLLFHRKKEWINFELFPRTQTLFGSSRGKFKYALGLTLGINGFLYDEIYYTINLGYFFLSDFHQINDIDRLNPSQLPNVRTDVINYYQQKSITLDEAYMEKVWNWGKGWYTRIAIGLLEIEYAGAATEWLYYPVNSPWAVGMDFAVLRKRTPDSWGFTNFVRKLDGYRPRWIRFTPTQYFLNVYYDWECTALEFKVSAGKFLADDFGVRMEVSRYFPSGLQIGFWYTLTNGHDQINGRTYYDKGVFFYGAPGYSLYKKHAFALGLWHVCLAERCWSKGEYRIRAILAD